MKVAFVGLGVMGGPMARHLAAKGHEVTVYNRTDEKSRAWVAAHGGEQAATPRAAAANADIVFVCVGNDDDVRSVVYGPDGVLAGNELLNFSLHLNNNKFQALHKFLDWKNHEVFLKLVYPSGRSVNDLLKQCQFSVNLQILFLVFWLFLDPKKSRGWHDSTKLDRLKYLNY